MRKEDLKDGMIIEVEFSDILNERFIKLGNMCVGINGYANLEDISNNLCWEKSKIVKVFKNKSMLDLEDINKDNKLELIWEREREVDWSKVPQWTPVQVWDQYEGDSVDSFFITYEPKLKFGIIIADNKDDEPRGYKHCKIHPSVEIKEEWYK